MRCLLSLLAGLGILLGGCSSGGPSFDPSGPCTTDGQRAGAYPDLERQIPAVLDGRPPNRVDSGRNCTTARLGTLAGRGVRELRFAGGLWETGVRGGTTLALFAAPSLTPDLVAEFYEAGARAGRKTENVQRSTAAIRGLPVTRIDTLNDQSFQTIAVLDSLATAPGHVAVALVATDVRDTPDRAAHEAAVASAVAAWAATAGASR